MVGVLALYLIVIIWNLWLELVVQYKGNVVESRWIRCEELIREVGGVSKLELCILNYLVYYVVIG